MSDEEVVLVGLGVLVVVEPVVEPLVAGPRQDPEDLLSGACTGQGRGTGSMS